MGGYKTKKESIMSKEAEAIIKLCEVITNKIFPLINDIGDRNYNSWLTNISSEISVIKDKLKENENET